MKREELERISEFRAIFEGNDWIREEIDIWGRQKERDDELERICV